MEFESSNPTLTPKLGMERTWQWCKQSFILLQYIFKFISIQVRFIAWFITQLWCKRMWKYIVNFKIHYKNNWNPNDTMLRKQPIEISATHHHLAIVIDCNSLIRTMGLCSQAGQMVGPMTLEGETLTLTALACMERSLSINVLWSFQSLFKLFPFNRISSYAMQPNRISAYATFNFPGFLL